MARKRQAPPPWKWITTWRDSDPNAKSFQWAGTVDIYWGTAKVEVSSDTIGELFAQIVAGQLRYPFPENNEPIEITGGPEFDAVRDHMALVYEIAADELPQTLGSAIKKAFISVLRRLPVESERRGMAIRPEGKRGRKPGSKEKPERVTSKVNRRIAEMEEAARRLARRKNANWSWAGLAGEMGLLPQTLLAYAKKHPEVRERGEKIMRERGHNF